MTFKELYKSGAKVEVDFIKRDGTPRHMICQRDSLLESLVKGVVKTKSEDAVRVVELAADGTKQWRSVPVNRIERFVKI